MADYLTVAEVYRMQHRLIEMFGGLHGVRDKGAVEAAVFSSANRLLQLARRRSGRADGVARKQPGFLDGNKRIAFTAADVFCGATDFTSRSKV